jgi:predicted small lipoprotein YifL
VKTGKTFLLLLALVGSLTACGADDDLQDLPYDAIAAGESPEPEPRPEETKKNWEETFLFDVGTSYDAFDQHKDEELISAGHAACRELGYDYGDGTFSGAHAAIARVKEMLDEGDSVAYKLVEVANRHLCEWSHLAEDGSMELPPLSDFSN